MPSSGNWATLEVVASRTEHVFVYGTLRRGQALHGQLERAGAEFVGEGWIRGRLYDLGEYPGAVPSDLGNEQVFGELYRLGRPSEQLPILDEVEECDPDDPERSLFIRRRVDVRLGDGRITHALVYVLPREPESAQRIPGGDFAGWRGSAAS